MYSKSKKIKTYFNAFKQLAEARLNGKSMPIMVELQINKECNLKCRYCYAQLDTLRANKDFSTQEIKNIIDELYSLGMRVIRILGGEPLMRKDVGEIISYLRGKNCFIEMSTNGTLLKSKVKSIKELALLDILQISIDGNAAANDAARGKGTYANIIEGIEAALAGGLAIRLHGVYNKFSIQASPESPVEHLARLSTKYKIPFNFCQYVSCIDGERDEAYIEHKEIMKRKYYQQCLEYKKKGYIFFNSFDALRQIMNWPDENKEFIFETDDKPSFFSRCRGGELYCFIDSDGSMYPCVPLWKKGINVKEVGIKAAWDFMQKVRNQASCFSCVSMGDIEFSKTMSLNPKVLFNTLKRVFSLS